MREHGYAVVDVETTGLRPAWHDRVVEVGVVQVDGSGRVTGEWGTLVNPGRDLGPQRIHRISAADVRHAPSFADIAGTLAGLLRGRVVCAHNLPFDLLFLSSEFARLGAEAPLRPEAGVCTMRWAPHFMPGAPRNLAGCCALAEVDLSGHHDAVVDARAAAGLLGHYIARAGERVPWQGLFAGSAAAPWPDLTGAAAPVRRGVSADRDTPFLERILDRMPRVPEPAVADSYLALLDQALLDHHISPTEADALVDFAALMGLGRADLGRLHLDYLAALVRAAMAEGEATDAHREEFAHVTRILGLPGDAPARVAAGEGRPRPGVPFRLEQGDMVAFTGETEEERAVWEARARVAGYVPHPRVTRQVRLLVAADPDTLSRKARTARIYGVPIVTTEAFLRMTGR
ncbi:hypothetical protein Ssi03_37360 [Sphaerisporangium siamense]|uniref:DNA polymerase-3 subunit epsilon n=1 Tax=Sphaerisporangium siamense TaxID=795645 RepID=A0A7W7GC33_9ACTN|nr:exonuclease domain-containing protein [Sphaerisporangium siamense]MBB4701621.1 DNA polymerase-3 subunit epsilon [Sphaerisporangium siamense]GII85746.1 hypothetical protein Ssi03_37360 [Sphaerisporangium siamense]